MNPTNPSEIRRARNPHATQRNPPQPDSGSYPGLLTAGNTQPGVALGFWVLG